MQKRRNKTLIIWITSATTTITTFWAMKRAISRKKRRSSIIWSWMSTPTTSSRSRSEFCRTLRQLSKGGEATETLATNTWSSLDWNMKLRWENLSVLLVILRNLGNGKHSSIIFNGRMATFGSAETRYIPALISFSTNIFFWKMTKWNAGSKELTESLNLLFLQKNRNTTDTT